MKKSLGLVAAAAAAALALTACSSGADAGSTASAPASPADNAGKSITLWLAGGDTPDELRTYLKTAFKAKTGADLVIEEQSWGDLLTKLTTALPDAENTPDVVELGNTQAPTFTNVGAFSDVSDLYQELGGAKLLPSFVEAGSVDGKQYALPYYFGSRYMFVRKDVWSEAGVAEPTTLDEFNAAVAAVAQANPRDIKNFSGFFIGGQDWRNGISWIFANGGDLAKKVDGQWQSTLADPNSLKGLAQLQAIYKTASTGLSSGVILASYSAARAARSVESFTLPKNSSMSCADSTAAQPGAAGVSLELDAEAMSAFANSSSPRALT